MGRPLAEAVDWLRLQLEDGPVPVVVLKRTAKEAGFVWQEMKKARKALGVESIRTNRSWVWKLPRDPDAPINTITHQAEARALMKAADRTMTDAERKRKFLDAYRELHFIKDACKATGISRGTHIYWLNSDPDYAELFEYARQDVLDTLEAEAWRRGYEGVERIKYYKGKEIGREREYSDQLLQLLLKANAPEKFGDKAVLDVNMRSLMGSIPRAVSDLSDEELQRIRQGEHPLSVLAAAARRRIEAPRGREIIVEDDHGRSR